MAEAGEAEDEAGEQEPPTKARQADSGFEEGVAVYAVFFWQRNEMRTKRISQGCLRRVLGLWGPREASRARLLS